MMMLTFEIFGRARNDGKNSQNCVRPPLQVSFINDEEQLKSLDINAEAKILLRNIFLL